MEIPDTATNGPSAASWKHRIQLHYIQPDKPQLNTFVERFIELSNTNDCINICLNRLTTHWKRKSNDLDVTEIIILILRWMQSYLLRCLYS